jgi:RNA polymerase sigma factor (sigma-70 family)
VPLDQTLVERARQGDPVALEDLLAHCQPDMRRIAHAECASHSDAEDAVQESLWLVYRRIGALRTLAAFPAWMFSIIRRECYRLMHRGRLPAPLPDPDDVLFAYHDHPDLQADLVAAIASLPPKYREAIVLRDYNECSIRDIADRLKLTREAIKSRIHRGRLMIREYLSD